jgi:predicted RNA-binding protein
MALMVDLQEKKELKMNHNFKRRFQAIVLASVISQAATVFAAQDVVGAVEGSVKKIDATSKVVAVDTADGARHSYSLADDLVVHTGNGAADSLRDIKVGGKVAVHYTVEDGRETAHEVDRLGDDGLRAAKGTVSHMDLAAKKISIKAADGSMQTFDLTDRAAEDAARSIGKSGKRIVYYSDEGGKKTVHFISAAM